MNPKQKINLFKIIPFSIIWGLFGFMYVLLEYGIMGDAEAYPSTNNPYDFLSSLLVYTSATFIMGIVLGSIEVLLLSKLFVRRTFIEKIIIKTVIYLLAILILIMIISFVISALRFQVSLFHPNVIDAIAVFITNFALWAIVIYLSSIIVISLFISEVSDRLGGSILNYFFTGKYHHPLEEERIFMFLDIRSSTAIAERLGHVKYFRLLNDYYSDITNSIIYTAGEIYQYAGDGIIISWNLKKGLTNNNCIHCYFEIKETIRALSERYIRKFGLTLELKAGLHCGKVTTGEIGVLKKEIFFTGDVLNTTARIESYCNKFKTDILISEDLLSRLDINDKYDFSAFGEYEMIGRKDKVNLFSILKNN